MCSCFLVSTFVCSWFGLLFVEYMMLFIIMKGRKQCLRINYLFQDGVNIVAYLNMDSHKTSNTRRISHCA
jgi:hypothetical protein